MASAAPSTQELDGIRERADRFIAELDEEYYLHYAGHKDTLDLSPFTAAPRACACSRVESSG